MRRLYTPEQFSKLSDRERDAGDISVATTSAGAIDINEVDRTVRYIISTAAVARDLNTISSDAWELENYRSNPVFLWAHDDTEPPIGRMIQIGDVNGILRGTVEYAPRDLNPFADTIYRLVIGKYLHAVSVSWMPLKWKVSSDKSRQGGIDFLKVDCLEVSQVPIPALPEALATARSSGIDTGPLFHWAEKVLDKGGMLLVPRAELETMRRAAKMPAKSTTESALAVGDQGARLAAVGRRAADSWKVGAAKDLPIEESDEWDGSAAEKSIFEWAGGDEFDSSKARKGFLVYNSAKSDERGSYKLPIAHVVDGELKVPHGAIKAASSRLPQTDVPDDVKTRAEAVLNSYKKRAGIGQDDDDSTEERALKAKHARALARAPKVPVFKRGLYDVAQLCYLLENLGYCHNSSEYEAELEGDESDVPAMLGEALMALGEALKSMATEEVNELLESHQDDGDEDEEAAVEARALSTEQRAHIAAGKTSRARAWRAGLAIARAGKTISATNKEKLESADDHHDRALKHSKALGEHHDAVSGHLKEARAAHAEVTQTLSEFGEHARAAQAEPEKAPEHLKRAMKSHAKAEDQMGAIADSHDDMSDKHEDAKDSHAGMERSVRSAQKYVRSVMDGVVSSEADEPDADDLQKKQAANEERARAARAARAKELAAKYREPITLTE